jgi:hypothetical protein
MHSIGKEVYRSITVDQGGPVAALVFSEIILFDRPYFQAHARLEEGLLPSSRYRCFGDCHGTGTHGVAGVARHLAISEALERWAYHRMLNAGGRRRFGLDVDPTSNGFAACPGVLPPAARESALFEAIARFCLSAWWEGRLASRWMQTDWPGIDAICISAPQGGFVVVLTKVSAHGLRGYGHGAAPTFTGACERAMLELARCEAALRAWDPRAQVAPTDLVERRMLFFASRVGFAAVCDRVGRRPADSPTMVSLACDEEVVGPWSRHATVWRCLFYPPSLDFLKPSAEYFFW